MTVRRISRVTFVSALSALWGVVPAWAQSPAAHAVPLPGEASQSALVAPQTVGPTAVLDGEPLPPLPIMVDGPSPCGCCTHGLMYRVGYCIRDNLIGYPEYFQEPRLGASLYENMGRQKAKGDLHIYTLYRSDFMAGSSELSPAGARRLSFLASRLNRWGGPVVVEWTPEQPGLAHARRATIVAALQGGMLPIDAGRVLVGPSAFRGIMGPDAGNNHDALIFRDMTAPRSFSVSPTSTAEFGGGAR